MGKKTLTNAHCLLELVELATVPTLKTFSGLQECQALARGFDWSQGDDQLSVALVEHIKHLRKEIARLSAEVLTLTLSDGTVCRANWAAAPWPPTPLVLIPCGA